MSQIEFNRSAINATDCISRGWELIKNEYWMFLGISLVAMILISCIPCLNIFLYGPILCGIFIVMLTKMRGEMVDFGMMFKGFENFLPAMIVGIIMMLPEIIGQFVRFGFQFGGQILQNSGANSNDKTTQLLGSGLVIIAGLLALVFLVLTLALRISFIFALPLIAEYKLNVMDAIKLSARAGWANIGGIIVLSILEGLMVIGGALLCLIGMFFVMPILYAANAIAYRQVFPGGGQASQPVPPMPNYYGGGFGSGQ